MCCRVTTCQPRRSWRRSASWRPRGGGCRSQAGGPTPMPAGTLARKRGVMLSMDIYWFDVEVAGPVTGDCAEELGEVLSARGGIDATVQAGHRRGQVMFSREADDAVQALVSAVEDVEAAGMRVTGVTEDRVVADEI